MTLPYNVPGQSQSALDYRVIFNSISSLAEELGTID